MGTPTRKGAIITIYFTADPHIGHRSVSYLRRYGAWPQDKSLVTPEDVEWHNGMIAQRWDETVRSGDQVWVLGDLTVNTSHLPRALDWIAERPGEKHFIAGNHDACLDDQTRVVTRRGFVPIAELDPHDAVLTVNDEMQAVWVLPRAVVRYRYQGDLVRFTNGHVDSMTTPDHRVVGLTRARREWTESRADRTRWSTLITVSAGIGSKDDPDISDDLIRLAAWAHTDSHRRHGSWTFYQSGEKYHRIADLLGPDCTVRERHRDITEIDGKTLRESPQPQFELRVKAGVLNQQISRLVPDKDSLAPWVWHLSERQVDLLVEEWVFTDGTLPTNKGAARVIYCSREGLRHQLMTLMVANGWRVSETEYRPGHWRINATKTMESHNQRGVRVETPYDGEVWCLQVPPYGRFFVERSGKVFLTGNCHPMHRDSHKYERHYYRAFHSVAMARKRVLNGQKFLLSHFPFSGDGHLREDRYTQWRLPNEGHVVLHGHTHTTEVVSWDKGTPQIHVGLDAHDFAPVSLETVLKILHETKATPSLKGVR